MGPLHKQVDELVSLMIVITLDDFDPEESFNTDSEIDWDKVREISASIREAFNRF